MPQPINYSDVVTALRHLIDFAPNCVDSRAFETVEELADEIESSGRRDMSSIEEALNHYCE